MLIKRFISLVLCIVICSVMLTFSVSSLDISARSAVVINCDTGEIVYSKNANETRSMASTTKIMTALLAIESGKLNDIVHIKNDVVTEGTSIGVKKGNKYKLIDLVYAMMLESGNDAAYSVACYLNGSEEEFAFKMNEKAREVGMSDTNFVTSSGLDAEAHYTTAYDMALLGVYAIKNDTFRQICSTQRKLITLIEPKVTLNLFNHNRLLGTLDGVIGIKTGYTKKSGRCLVTACKRNSVTYVAVTLNAPDDWQDHEKLYTYAFSHTKSISVDTQAPSEISVYGGVAESVKLSSADTVKISYVRKTDYKSKVIIPKFIYAPVNKGDIIGKVVFNFSDKSVYESNITAAESIDSVTGKDSPDNILIRLIRKIFT